MPIEILISTYNRVRFLKEAINSVLNQTHQDFLITIVDSGSTDSTNEYLLSLNDKRIRVIRFDDNLGISKNIERAMAQTNQRFVVLFHDDDVMMPYLLETYVESLNEDMVLYHSDIIHIDSKGNKLDEIRPNVQELIQRSEYIDLLMRDRKAASIVMPTVMVDTKRLRDTGVWPLKLNPKMSMLVDMGIWMQINEFGSFKFINKKCLKYRLHQKSGTSLFGKKINEMLKNRLAIYKEINSRRQSFFARILSIKLFIKSVLFDIKVLMLK